MILACLIIILFISLIFLLRKVPLHFFSLVYLYVFFILLSLIFTTIYHLFISADNGINLFGLDEIKISEFFRTIELFTLSLISFIVGVLLNHYTCKKQSPTYIQKIRTKATKVKIWFFVSLGLFFIIVFLYFILYGTTCGLYGFLQREFYFIEGNIYLKSCIFLISIFEILVLGTIFPKLKVYSSAIFIFIILLSLSTGSRKTIFFITIFFLTIYMNRPIFFSGFYKKFLFSISFFIFCIWVFNHRNLENHGLIPYVFSSLSSHQDLSSLLYPSMFAVYYIFVFGFYVASSTIDIGNLGTKEFIVAVNPLPGKFAGWYSISEEMRLNVFAPYNLFGEVFLMGATISIFFFIIIGIIFGYLENEFKTLRNQGYFFASLLLYLFIVIFIIYAYEYNMRSAVRFIYYSISYVFVMKIVLFFKSKRKRYRT